MNEPVPLPGEISASQQHLLNRVCDEFEAQWKGGNSPRLEDYLAQAPAVDVPAFLRELLALELSYLADRGDQPRADDYCRRFAEHSETISGVFEEIGARASSRRPTDDLSGVPHGAPHAAPENELHPGPSFERSTSYYHAIEPGVVIGGRFKLVNRIGEGGMGEVWVAKQSEPVKRKVAVKLIKSGMDSKAVVARFEHERQALAMMDHPNIARVLDGGITPDGRPYFVMELVNGLPLTKFCDEAKLTPRERLELFVPVCQAVQHAHQKAIVHRDLKPSNVLVTVHDGKPVPKVIDFGVAKATGGKLTDDTLSTQFGAVVGTLEYMSPEQAGYSGADVDTRADIYSLGVILYELLTGLRPVDGQRLRKAALAEMIRIIQEEEPLRPSNRLSTDEALPSLAALRQIEPKRLMAMLRGELDWVVMRCLEKDRNRRYDTANGLARDIQHYLADEPVEARPPSARYRTGKFLVRHKGPVLAAALVLLALISGVVGTTWGLFRAEKSREAEAEQRGIAETKKQEAERDRAQAVAARNAEAHERRRAEWNANDARNQRDRAERERQLAQAVRDFLQQKLLGQADARSQAEALIRMGGLASAAKENPTIRELLDRAATELSPDKIEDSFPGAPQVQAEILRTVGNAYQGIGEYASAVSFLQRAAGIFREHLGEDDLETLATLRNLGRAQQDNGMFLDAVHLYQRLRGAIQRKLGPQDPKTLTITHDLAWALLAAGKVAESIQLLEQVRDAMEQAPDSEQSSNATVLHSLATAYKIAGRHEDAVRLFGQLHETQEKKLGPDHPDALLSMAGLAMAHLDAGEYRKALDLFKQVREGQEKKFGADHPTTLTTMNNLALAHQAMGNVSEAIRLLEQAREGQEKKLGPDHPHLLTTLYNLAQARLAAKERPLAIRLLEQVRAASEAILGGDHPQTLSTIAALASAYLAAERLSDAIGLFEQLREVMEKKFGLEHPHTLATLQNLALAYKSVGKLPEAVRLYEQVRDIRERNYGPDYPELLTTLNNLAMAYQESGDLSAAIPLFERAHQGFERRFGADHDDTLLALNNLALAHHAAGQRPAALEEFDQLRKANERKLGPDHPHTIMALNNLATVYQESSEPAMALPFLEQAANAIERRHNVDSLAHTIMMNLAHCHETLGHFDAAEPWRRKLRTVVKELAGEESPAYAGALIQLGVNLLRQKEYTDAEGVLKECLAFRERVEPDMWTTFNTKSMLGESLLGQGKFADAEPMLLTGYEGMKARDATIPPVAIGRMAEAIQRLVDLYTATGQAEKTDEWRAKLEAARANEPEAEP